jgi:hypothetical protein
LFSFTSVYFFESRLFNKLRPIQIEKIASSAGTTDAGKFAAQTSRCTGAEFSAGGFYHCDIIALASALRKKMSTNS